MAQINILLNDIKRIVRQGGNVTHILNVKVAKEQQNEMGSAIRQAIFHRICGQPLTERVCNVNVAITWQSSATQSSAYYYSDNYVIDSYVKKHTRLLFRRILAELDETFGNVNGVAGLAFIFTRPIMRQVADYEDSDIEQERGDVEIRTNF